MSVDQLFTRVMAGDDAKVKERFSTLGFDLSDDELETFLSAKHAYRKSAVKMGVSLLMWIIFGVILISTQIKLDTSLQFFVSVIIGLSVLFSIKMSKKTEKNVKECIQSIINAHKSV